AEDHAQRMIEQLLRVLEQIEDLGAEDADHHRDEDQVADEQACSRWHDTQLLAASDFLSEHEHGQEHRDEHDHAEDGNRQMPLRPENCVHYIRDVRKGHRRGSLQLRPCSQYSDMPRKLGIVRYLCPRGEGSKLENLFSSAAMASCASTRASGAPRQVCLPPPKD